MNPDDFYAVNPQHRANVAAFLGGVVAEYPMLRFFWPNKPMAPWHVQVKLDKMDGETIYLNFYPHTLKYASSHGPKGKGIKGMQQMIERALDRVEKVEKAYYDHYRQQQEEAP